MTAKTKLQAELETILRFFEACPVSMRIQLSIIPKLPVEDGIKVVDDGHILLLQNQANDDEEAAEKAAAEAYGNTRMTRTVLANSSTSGPGGIFGKLVEKMIKEKRKKIRRQWLRENAEVEEEDRPPMPQPTKPLYVNNINSQRMHDCCPGAGW